MMKLRHIIPIALAGAAAVVAYGQRDRFFTVREPLPDSEEFSTHWVCHDCGATFTMTPREYNPKVQQRVENEHVDNGRPKIAHIRSVIPCQQCGKDAVSARKCIVDGTIFDPRVGRNSDGRCPKCHWNPNG